MEYLPLIALVLVAALIITLLLKIFKAPLKLAFKLLINSGLGFLALLLINFLGEPLGIALGVSWLNALVIGVLGVPGALLLVIINLLL